MMKKRNPPAFQAYASDILADTEIQQMSAEEFGCYWLLLLNLWVAGGQLANDIPHLMRMMHLLRRVPQRNPRFLPAGKILAYGKSDITGSNCRGFPFHRRSRRRAGLRKMRLRFCLSYTFPYCQQPGQFPIVHLCKLQ